jgi:hypothetical protein
MTAPTASGTLVGEVVSFQSAVEASSRLVASVLQAEVAAVRDLEWLALRTPVVSELRQQEAEGRIASTPQDLRDTTILQQLQYRHRPLSSSAWACRRRTDRLAAVRHPCPMPPSG